MKYTTNLKLKKPDYTDPADIADINSNFDKIDGEMLKSSNFAWEKIANITLQNNTTKQVDLVDLGLENYSFLKCIVSAKSYEGGPYRYEMRLNDKSWSTNIYNGHYITLGNNVWLECNYINIDDGLSQDDMTRYSYTEFNIHNIEPSSSILAVSSTFDNVGKESIKVHSVKFRPELINKISFIGGTYFKSGSKIVIMGVK